MGFIGLIGTFGILFGILIAVISAGIAMFIAGTILINKKRRKTGTILRIISYIILVPLIFTLIMLLCFMWHDTFN